MNPKSARDRSLHRTQADILGEKAGTLARARERLEHVVTELITLRATIAEAASRSASGGTPGSAHDSALAEQGKKWQDLTRQARRFRHALIHQRKACGFRRHGDVERHYPIPDVPGRVPGMDTKERP